MAPRVIVPMLGANGVLADLSAWGHDCTEWWALVSGIVYGNSPTGNGYLNQSAWVPAHRVVRSADPGLGIAYKRVERLDLPADRSVWPTPAASVNRVWLHHGPVTRSPPAALGVRPIPQPPP